MPADATTGSTILNDVTGLVDGALVYGALLFTGIVIGYGLVQMALALRADWKRKREGGDENSPR